MTCLCAFESKDDSVAEVSSTGEIKALRPGTPAIDPDAVRRALQA